MEVNGLADGNGAFLASAGENWTQSACGESPVAEGIESLCLVGEKRGNMWGQGFGLFL